HEALSLDRGVDLAALGGAVGGTGERIEDRVAAAVVVISDALADEPVLTDVVLHPAGRGGVGAALVGVRGITGAVHGEQGRAAGDGALLDRAEGGLLAVDQADRAAGAAGQPAVRALVHADRVREDRVVLVPVGVDQRVGVLGADVRARLTRVARV